MIRYSGNIPTSISILLKPSYPHAGVSDEVVDPKLSDVREMFGTYDFL